MRAPLPGVLAVVDSMPPGGIGNLVFVPLCAVALWFSLPRREAPGGATAPTA